MIRALVLLICFSGTVYSQDIPMEDKFTFDSRIHSAKTNLKVYQEYLDQFNVKFSGARELSEKQALVVQKLEDEKKRIEKLPEKKRSKQEKEYVALSTCMKGFISEGKNKNESANFIYQCFYTHNIDPRHFRKSPKGKILGESSEIQKEGDALSMLVDTLMHSGLSEDDLAKIKEYQKAKEYKLTLETSSIARAKNDLENLEKRLLARKELDELIGKNMKCESEMKLELNNYKTDVVGDLLASVLKRDVGPSLNDGKICSSFDGVKLNLMFKQEDPECAANKVTLNGVYCDKSYTPNIIYNKDADKARSEFRRIVVTQLSQKLPVGIIREKTSSSIIGMKNDKGECMYLVKDYQKGASEWVGESSVLQKLEEINFLKRQ